jgi:hypothetical protein
MGIETAVKDAHVRKVCEGRQRSILAAAVNHDNVLSSGKMGQRAPDILFLVIRQKDWGNFIKHLQVRLRRTHGLDL